MTPTLTSVTAADDPSNDSIHSAMKSVFDDLAASRNGVANDLSGRPTAAAAMGAGGSISQPSTDALALAMGLNGNGSVTPRETHVEQARRILSGQPASITGNVNLDNAMGVSRLRGSLAAQRNYRLNVAGNIPTADTTPEIAANNLNYLDLLTLRGAGDPMGDNIEESRGGSTIDQRRARVQAMSDLGSTESASPAEKNRRALIAAMSPISVPDPANPGKTISRAPTPEEAMLGFSKSGGTGLTMDAVVKAYDSQAMAKGTAAKGVKADATDEYNKMIGAYRDTLGKKDYLAARFWAQKLGHKFDPDTPFSPEQLPGYSDAPAGPAAPGAPTATPAVLPSPDAIAHLRQNPTLSQAFDAKYGAGASLKALGK